MEDKTIRELLPGFYKQYNLGIDGGQSSSSVRVELSKNIILYIPNFTARKKAVLKHDIHHIITGYPSTFKGESEIGAWEIGSGCRHYGAAWILDASGFMTGILFNLWGVLKAFARGRKTRNLYFDKITDGEALEMRVSEIQNILFLDTFPKNTRPGFIDYVFFALYALAGLIYSVVSILLIPFVLGYTIYIKQQSKKIVAGQL